jgi:hypothetical protein
VKKISGFLFLAIFTPLLFMQVSCSTVKEEPSEGAAAKEVKAPEAVKAVEVVKAQEAVKTSETEKTSEAAVTTAFLADTHKKSGIECSACHKETPPASEVPTERCMLCHEDYRNVASSAIDPHNAHVEFTRCGDCHHGHRESENQCLSCHSFSMKTP